MEFSVDEKKNISLDEIFFFCDAEAESEMEKLEVGKLHEL